jgi:hypothetical protein
VHWESRWVAPHLMIARGWERQLDIGRDAVFYDSKPLTPAAYHAWLAELAVSYVAVSDAKPDYSSESEARLLRRTPPPYLRELWRSRHWRLFAVLDASPLAAPPASLSAVGRESFTLLAPAAGSYVVRLRFTPYWALTRGHGCVSRAPGGWTRVQTRGAGAVELAIAFSLGRVFDRGPRCA